MYNLTLSWAPLNPYEGTHWRTVCDPGALAPKGPFSIRLSYKKRLCIVMIQNDCFPSFYRPFLLLLSHILFLLSPPFLFLIILYYLYSYSASYFPPPTSPSSPPCHCFLLSASLCALASCIYCQSVLLQ